MDRLANWTTTTARGVQSTAVPGQNCELPLEKFLVITPSWESVSLDLRWFFPLHTYAFACLFFGLSFYTFFSFLNLRSLISSPPLMSTINIFLCLLGASRSSCLVIDPYNLKEIMPKYIGSVIWDIGFPFVTSAFCLIQLVFLQLTQLKFGLERFQKETYLSLVIICHFTCVIVSDITQAFHVSYSAKYVVQAIFLVWALVLYATFLYAGCKVRALLRRLPTNLLARDALGATNQKGIMQLAMLAPYNNLATSVAAALVPTLLGPRMNSRAFGSGDDGQTNGRGPDTNHGLSSSISCTSTNRGCSPSRPHHQSEESDEVNGVLVSSSSRHRQSAACSPPDELHQQHVHHHHRQPVVTTVPEVYVRPPTPTPSLANLPIITVSSPSRRSSLASRRGSDASRNSRRASECSVRFVSEEEEGAPTSPTRSNAEAGKDAKRSTEPESIVSPRHSPVLDRPRSPEGILRRNSDCPSTTTPTGSNRDLRRCSDFTHGGSGGEKCRSQFATKLRRNSDFGNRTPRRASAAGSQQQQQESEQQSRLSRILDVSPTGSRRNSDLGGLIPVKAVESRRNSDVSCRVSSAERRGSELAHQIKHHRFANDDHSPDDDATESRRQREMKSESSDSDQHQDNYYGGAGCDDGAGSGDTAALVTRSADDEQGASCSSNNNNNKARKKNLSWKSDSKAATRDDHQEDITAETSLLGDVHQEAGGVTGGDFTLHSILNHIAYVNRAKSDTPLHIPEASIAAARRAQIKRVLNVTYLTAILGIVLCLADVLRIFGPYGLLAEVVISGAKPQATQFPKPWPWIIYQTGCRFLELLMGCAMASITKQPSASPRHNQYLMSNYPNYNLRMKQRDNLYI